MQTPTDGSTRSTSSESRITPRHRLSALSKHWQLAATYVAIVGVLASSGCTTVSRTIGSVTSNKYAHPRAGSNWIVPPPQLEPLPDGQKTAYLSFRNISDAATVDLTAALKNAAQSQGWTLVSDPSQANVRLRASLRYFGEVDPESGGRGVAQAMGVISGAAVGLGTYGAVENATDSWAAGAAAGVGAGGLTGIGMKNGSTVREWAMVIDFVLEERSDKPIEFELYSGTESAASTGVALGNGRASESGGTNQRNSRQATTKQQGNYFPHGVRLSAWANQMNMEEDEALPHIQSKVQSVVLQMLPQ